uniref:Uncharacterized protein n=1 Tax=Caenorhabditis japonica TaxID=281687 RepID=A0A8R1EDV0_CAEJA
MVEFLNNFGNDMEEVLERAEHSLEVAERKLFLMEAKLSDVKLEDVEVVESVQTTSKITEEIVVVAETSEPKSSESPVIQECAPSQTILIKNDAAYSKYFKMLKMGVPEAGVVQKMAAEGVDPSILQRGDEPSRLQIEYDSSGESISSFSDSD